MYLHFAVKRRTLEHYTNIVTPSKFDHEFELKYCDVCFPTKTYVSLLKIFFVHAICTQGFDEKTTGVRTKYAFY